MALQVTLVSKGEVQGVGYRAYVEFVAKKMRIGGWVRNLPDGNVETAAIVEDEEQLKKFIEEIGIKARGKNLGINVEEVKIVEKSKIEKTGNGCFRIAF